MSISQKHIRLGRETLRRPVFFSAIVHLLVFTIVSIIPGIYLPTKDRSTRITWVELPKGTSEEIGIGIKKSDELPKSTIEEQKKLFVPEQKPLEPQTKTAQKPQEPQAMQKMAEPAKLPKKPAPARASSTDKKIASALAMIDKELAKRAVAPEAAQIKESGEGYKYGTGNQPLRVMPSDPEYLKYQAMVRAKIIQEWVLPLKYIEENQPHRQCAIDVMINLDGEVVSTQWETPSGDPTFDASAVRAVRKASPFPKPPDRLAWEAYNEGFLIEFDPRLKPQ